MSQAAVAQAVGVTQAYISKVELGHKYPGHTVLLKLMELTGLSAEDFVRPFQRRRAPVRL